MSIAILPNRSTAPLGLNKHDQAIMDHCIAFSSDVWTGYVDGKIACMWGVAPPSLLATRAYLWLYHTPLVKEHQFLFVRHSQRIIEGLLKEYDLITGHFVIGGPDSMRWLKWLGATFGEPEGNLIPFQIRKKDG